MERFLPSAPKFAVSKIKYEEDSDDDFISYDVQYHGGGHGGGGGASEKDRELYQKSMYKLKLVSFVSIFFIIC